MELTITTLAQRPELADAVLRMPDTRPHFLRQDPVGRQYFGRIAAEFPEYSLVATEPDGTVVARGFSVPFALRAVDVPGRGELPDAGWAQVLLWAFVDLRDGRVPDTVGAIEIFVAGDRRGRGIAGRMLTVMRANAGRLGFAEVVAPVRPNAKHLEMRAPIEEYAYRTREDGLPCDPWLRVHVRAGGEIVGIAAESMRVVGSLEQWRRCTGLPFDDAGDVEVPGALMPVRCSVQRKYAVYVEPHVWVRHRL
ncbi:N-acetyltransferase [Streptomyces sp. NPDC057543]|uniref:N-acetyltransferase n=1 Tax=Streptomyces sp. NPDC057543 TaxID=3346163 RepID=UPI0036921429